MCLMKCKSFFCMFFIMCGLLFGSLGVYAAELEKDAVGMSIEQEETIQEDLTEKDFIDETLAEEMLTEEDVIIRKILDGTDNVGEDLRSVNVYKKTIRVAWYEREGYFEIDDDGNMVGFGMEYLDAISEYTGWNYEFLQGTREQCIDYLEIGLADIMAPVGVDEDLENAMIVREVIGEDYGYIYKSSNNYYLNFEDIESFPKVILGVEHNKGLLESLKRYCDEKNIRFYDIVMYETIEEMRKDLSAGKIDAFVTDSFVNMENMKVVGRFSNSRVTFATTKDYVYEQVNYALEQIKLNNPYFANELKEKYYGEGSQNVLEYTQDERSFLNDSHKYDVVLNGDQYPISYINNERSSYNGIGKDVLERIGNQTGINFRIVYENNFSEAESMLHNGSVDILGGVIVNSQDIKSLNAREKAKENSQIRLTEAFYDIDLAFVGRKNVNFDDNLLVAIPAYMELASEDFEKSYGGYDFVIYETDDACLEAVINKEADVAIQPDLKINEIIIYEKYKALQNLKYVPGDYVASFVVNTKDEQLVTIINKAIKTISATAMATIENNNIQHIAMRSMSMGDFIRVYKWYILATISIFIFLLIAAFMYFRYRKEAADKEKAYKDSVANISSMEKFRIDVEPILKAESKKDYYLIVVDIDKFKVINTLYGYEKGDQVIAFLAKKLQKELKESDYITRSNADNFVVLKKAESETEIEKYLNNLFANVNIAIAEKHINYRMMIKAGIYQVEDTDNNISSIIDKAGMAKKTIGQIYKSTYAFYSEVMRQKAIEEKNLENEMEKALKNREFCIFLQPQIDLATKKIVSAEALVRWMHPEKGMIPPFKFIPVFENNGFISKLDMFVWEEAARTLRKWKDNNQIMVPIAINLSRVDVEQENLMDELLGLSEKYELGNQWIKMELTESVYSEEGTLIMERMKKIQEHGFKVAVDDFGSGYSSLHMLKKMPIDILKIDKSFLDVDMNMDIKDEIVIRDVIGMGKHLNLQIIVEGVETQEQSDFLESIGCDIVQGYFYGRPVPVKEFEIILKENHEGGQSNEI